MILMKSNYYNFWRRFSGFAALQVRRAVFNTFMKFMMPDKHTTILDVGVTGDLVNEADNYFEKFYLWPSKITALGIEDASYLEKKYPGLKFVKADGKNIPFGDKTFDIVFSSATLEHVGSRENQKKFVEEILRVGKKAFITTPNRFFPVEVHTGIPLLHFLPAKIYRKILRFLGLDFFAREENLNLLSRKELLEIIPENSVKVIKKSISLIVIKNSLR